MACKFQPDCNTSPTVAALFLISSTLIGASALVVGTVVPVLAPSKLLAIFVIRLPPLFNPSLVKDTCSLPAVTGVIVTPLPLITVLSPVSVLNSADFKFFNSFASFIFNLPSW